MLRISNITIRVFVSLFLLVGCFHSSSTLTVFNIPQSEIPVLEKEAEQGNVEAARRLAYYYEYSAPDLFKLMKYLKLGAEAGDLSAQLNLIDLLEHSAKENATEEVLIWLNKAAESGSGVAQFHLASKYEAGKNVIQDFAKAKIYYEKAAFSGEPDIEIQAMDKVFYFYSEGKGCVQNIIKAYAWLLLAESKRPNESAAGNMVSEKIEQLQHSLSDADIKEAEAEFQILLKK